MKKITVGNERIGEFNDRWKYCIGTGRLGLALRKDYQDHLRKVQEDIGFSYIRGHGLLHDDIGIYNKMEVDGKSVPFYNFTYIDQIFDSFLELGIRPFVEIGFMPKLLASGDQTIFYWKANVTPPKDYNKWRDLIVALVTHFIERYGLEEVLHWPFEIWNEPNLPGFWKDADKKEYFKLYKVTANAIKSVHPELKVGGPAICGGSDHWLVDFLNFCYEEKIPVDFVTRHAYSAKKPHKVTFDYYYQELWEPEDMLEELRSVREIIDNSPFPDLPLHITEYNTSYSPVNPVHDTVYNATYLARILSEAGDIVDSFSYWTFSDVFEEAGVPKAQFHGGFGLLAFNSIPKPTYHLFTFFNQLGKDLLYRDEETIITRREDGSVALIAWNLVMDPEEDRSKTITFEIPVASKDVFMKRSIVNEQFGNPFRVWQEMGRPRYPGKELVQILKQVASPHYETMRLESREGTVTYTVTLAKNEFTLIEFIPVRDETATYPGLDDALIYSEK